MSATWSDPPTFVAPTAVARERRHWLRVFLTRLVMPSASRTGEGPR